ncbi:MAG: Acyl-CoA dehydrogenase [Microbacteriaceae bacterium]|jgi:alkylation response protein AidB-like acyl-CoA dehydrogenase|nr:Acyl-CoA dehydrogenase [Microbacteriaceae bacterium]
MPRELFANPLTDGSHSRWLDVAETAASVLRQDIVSRDASGETPHYALEVLREHNLLSLVVPLELGGSGEPWSTAAEITRIIARADAGIAHALGYHYTWVWFVSAYGTESGRAVLRRTASESLFWASIGSAFGGSGSIRAHGGGHIVNAARGFATGAPLADVLFTQTVSTDDGRLYLSAIDTASDGVSVADDWDVLGQRLSASTGISLIDVEIGPANVITILPAPGDAPTPLQSLMIPTFQLLFAYLNLGITEGALLEARDYVLERGRPWVHSSVDRSSDDPFVVNLFGQKAARVLGVSAQIGAAQTVLSALLSGEIPITPQTRGQTAELIAAAKVVSHEVGLDVTTAIFDATGARSAASQFGLDRFWRNIRTITLHDPVAYKYNELGAYVLNGDLPEPSVYR